MIRATENKHYKIFPCAKEEKLPQDIDSMYIIMIIMMMTMIIIIITTTTEHFGWLVLFGKLSSARLLEKSSICPQLSA